MDSVRGSDLRVRFSGQASHHRQCHRFTVCGDEPDLYEAGQSGLVVNPEQTKLVKRIYGMFLQGQSPFQIARTLTEEGIPSPGGKDHWNPSNIKSILTNEKYKGDALLQKSFTVDFLTKKEKTNENEIKELFLRAANQVIDQKEQFIATYEQVLSRSLDTTALESELSDLEAEINIAAELIEECIKENAHVALDQDEYQKRYDALVARFDKAKSQTHRGYRPDCRAHGPKAPDRNVPEKTAEPGAAGGVPGNRLAGDGRFHHRPQQNGHQGDLQGWHRDQSIIS